MANEDKYPKSVGGEIPVVEAQQEMAAWKAANPGKVSSFRIDPKLITAALDNDFVNGILFCNGYDESYNFAPVMAGITKDGAPINCVNTNGAISYEEYKACRQRWAEEHPKELNYVYLGEDCLAEIGKSTEKYITAAFIIDKGNNDNIALFVKSKIDDGPEKEQSFNFGLPCPPKCPKGE